MERVHHHERRGERLRLGGVEPLGGQGDVQGVAQLALGGEGAAGAAEEHQEDQEQSHASTFLLTRPPWMWLFT